ncbi:MAG: hypothetical protein WD638_02745 [Nitriliruptoraceae bacterium]
MRRLTLGTAVFASAIVLAGCSSVPEGAAEAQALVCPPGDEGCDDVLPVGPGGAVELEMGNFFFNFTDGAAVTGAVEVTGANLSDTYHNVEILGSADGTYLGGSDGEAILGVGDSETDTGTGELFPGEWTVICNVPGHRAAGMETTITVYATEEEADAAIEAGETDADRDAAEANA